MAELIYAKVFIPPSVGDATTHNTTHLSAVPAAVTGATPCVLGVDEAGRGPVVGSMVYGVSYCRTDYHDELKKTYGFADSKTLSEERRSQLMREVCNPESELYRQVGWATRTLTAQDILLGMLRSVGAGNYNLNEQAHDATMLLIQSVLDQGVVVEHAYVDTVGPPGPYQKKLLERFPGVAFTVTKKADSIYPIVSTALVCAKVTRDADLEYHRLALGIGEWGSGYPSDPRTSQWLKGKVDPLFGWGYMVRFSWQTSKDALKQGIPVVWEDECAKEEYQMRWERSPWTSTPMSTQWYGESVAW